MKRPIEVTKADAQIQECLAGVRSFYVIAGAGSGKTTSLIGALDHLREIRGNVLRRSSQRILCLTFTKRAVAVIQSRLGWDDLFVVSTLHSFLWDEIKRFTNDIRSALSDAIIPDHIAKKKEDDNGGNSQKALAARARVLELEQNLANLTTVNKFSYNDSTYSDYTTGEIGHDDVIDIAAHLISNRRQLRRILGQKYPYIFVDEAQDTHENVVAALNSLCGEDGLPIVGYFGDPVQQIYDKRAGDFKGPPASLRIPKEENFRSSQAVVKLLNAFRTDIEQFPAGPNKDVEGSVLLALVQSEAPLAARGRYTPEQVDRASVKLDQVVENWGWKGDQEAKQLFLVRQMIARRLGFVSLHRLFTGAYASSRAQEQYETGEHSLLKPFVDSLFPLVKAARLNDPKELIAVLRRRTPTFDPKGVNAKQPLGKMTEKANSLVADLSEFWNAGTVGDVLRFARSSGLCPISRRLEEHLGRSPRNEAYVEEQHSLDKGDWLADEYFGMRTPEIEAYCEFVAERTPFSTQHGVKGEQYDRVLVVFDDVGSAWNNYNFAKTLTPHTAGEPTDRQRRLSTNLAYVCFSRAIRDLRIVLFSANADATKSELVARGYFTEEQVQVVL